MFYISLFQYNLPAAQAPRLSRKIFINPALVVKIELRSIYHHTVLGAAITADRSMYCFVVEGPLVMWQRLW